MGYKLAGCTVLGNCEIDKRMNEVYLANHKPKFNFNMDIRDFNKILKEELPEELLNLDILDGSPPCTTFSMAGQREKVWGVEKKFREGQKKQTLDDLSFVFIELVKKLKPKVVVMENVEGLLQGNAWKYVQKIYADFDDAGYQVNHYLLKGEKMGIPQTRHRVFFIAVRKDIPFNFGSLDMAFNYAPVTYGAIKSGIPRKMNPGTVFYRIACKANDKDKCIADTRERLGEKASAFQTYYIRDDMVMPTLRAHNDIIDLAELAYVSDETIRNAQTFPQDYDFLEYRTDYICGMSVPPVMMKRLVIRLIESGVFE